MKQHSTRASLLVIAAACLFTISATAENSINGAAKVIRLKGAARASSGNYVWQAIKEGDVLPPGTIIQTSADPGSYLDLALGDGSAAVGEPMIYRPSIPNSMAGAFTTFQPKSEQNTLRIWGDSALGIDKLTRLQTGADVVTETQLDLKRGRITAKVKKLSAASKYEVKFANGVAGVRGTVFDMQATGIIKVYIGSMIVAWVDPKTQAVTTQTVTGGQVYDTASNQVSLLSIASIDELEQTSGELVVSQAFPNSTTIAADRTAVGMSPVGANPASVPSPGQQGDGSTFTMVPTLPPVTVH